MKPTKNKIDEVLNKCEENIEEGGSKYPGMSFEEGVRDAIAWMQGEGPNPLGDDAD